MSYFSVAEMERGEADDAYVLVRAIAPEVPPELWSAFAAARIERGGMLALRSDSGAIFGFASYRIENGWRTGRILIVDNFVTAELSAAARGRKLMESALERIAAANGCSAVRQPVGCGNPAELAPGRLCNHLTLADGTVEGGCISP